MKKNASEKSRIQKEITVHDMIMEAQINLDLSRIYYISAIEQFDKGNLHYKKLLKECIKYNTAYDARLKKYKIASEEFYTYMLPRLRNIEPFYEKAVRHFSAGKILLVSCAESFINEVAAAKLSGRSLIEFDKLSILGKWIFIQDILKLKKRITLDKNPLQGFSALITERNKLVHFKGLHKKLNPFIIPTFLEDLKLTPEICKENVQAVRELLLELYYQWVGATNLSFANPDQKTIFRNPCFYLHNRECASYLHSGKLDKHS